MKFRNLLSPIKIGSVEVRNRIVMAPMGTNYLNFDGSVTERYAAFIEARAKGGAGLIITEAAHVQVSGKVSPFELGIDRDELIPGLRTVVQGAHRHGAKICLQLGHAGRQTHHAVTEQPLKAPSAIPCPLCREMPMEMSIAEIVQTVDVFAEAAVRAKKAGFDAVEIHGAHGYLISEFLSPYCNKRTDEFGGSLENRARFPLAILRTIKDKVGAGFPVIYRMNSAEFVADGFTIEEAKEFAVMLVDNGVDAIHVSGGVYESAAMVIAPPCIPQGYYAENAAAIRSAVNSRVPVIVVGRIKDPFLAENVIAAGKADMVSMGRALLADEDLPKKVSEGRLDEIRRCIACNQGCIDRHFVGEGITCIGNALTGREFEYDLSEKAAVSKKVLVVGGGPAGLEAARVAALRGHKVFLFEKADACGGQLNIAAVPPYKGEVAELADFLISQVKSLGVEIRLSRELTEADLDEIKPDVAIIACGSSPLVPDIKGVKGKNVCTAHDVLAGLVKPEGDVLVIGGGMVGCETAEYLSEKGFKVTIIEMLNKIAADVGMINRAMLLMRLQQRGIGILTESKLIEIKENGIAVEKAGRDEWIDNSGSVVLAMGSKPASSIQQLIESRNLPYFKIGDSVKAGKVLDAIHDAFLCAFRI